MTKHTLGHWTVIGPEGVGNHVWIGIRTECSTDPIGRAYGHGTEAIANARLMAAAPRLLEALANLINAVFDDAPPEAIIRARAAIDEATGESP